MQRKRPNSGRPGNSYVAANQTREKQLEQRLTWALFGALCLILPPIGLIVVWRSGRINNILRAVYSAAALAALTVMFSITVNAPAAVTGILPVPKTPSHAGYDANAIAATATPAPVIIDEFADYGDFTVSYGTPVTDENGVVIEDQLPVDPASQVTIVYAVTNNATYYHSQQMCDMQNNSRRLLLEDAIAEGLKPCEKCVVP